MSQRLPVTVLTGVGRTDGAQAIKTLLQGTNDVRLAAIVPRRNHKRMRVKNAAAVIPTTEKFVRLGQGCSCCTVRGDLMSKIRRVATEASADHLLVHAAAHSDLKTLAKTFTVADANGAMLSDNAQLQSLVAVVDASELLKTLPTESARPMVERIELADVIVVQGGQELPAEECSRLDDLIRVLSPAAKIIREDDTKLELSALRSDEPFDLRAAELRASRLGKPDTDFGTSGWLRQFTYFERIPFHPVRLHALLEENWPNVIRVQGSFWVASSPDYSITLDIAGGSRQTSCDGKWWITVPQDQRPKSPGFQQYLEGIWDPTFGDRHQALTIVGMGLDQDVLTQRLKQCLLTEEEMAHPETWPLMPHPFSWPRQ